MQSFLYIIPNNRNTFQKTQEFLSIDNDIGEGETSLENNERYRKVAWGLKL